MKILLRKGWLGVVLALAACADITSLGGPPAPISALPLYGGSVIAAVPEGYCIETRISRPTDGFAVMASCDAIAGQTGRPSLNGIVSVQVGASGSAFAPSEADALQALLRTPSGRALLSRSGAADQITVQSVGQSQDAVTVRFLDAGGPPVAGLQNTEWRGFFAIDQRLATVAVRGLADAPLGTDEGQLLLESVINAVQRINAGPETSSDG